MTGLTPEKVTASSFRRLIYSIKNDIMQYSNRQFNLLSGISELDIKSLMVRGDVHEKASIESGFLLLQMSGQADSFAASLREDLSPKTKLPPSSWQSMDTSELRLDHAAYVTLLKVMETTTLYALYNKGMTRQELMRTQGTSYQTSDRLLQPNAFQDTISTIGAWSRWISLVGASETVNSLLEDTIQDLKGAKDVTQQMQLILDRSRNTDELDDDKKLALSLSLEKNLSLNHSKGLAFTPSF